MNNDVIERISQALLTELNKREGTGLTIPLATIAQIALSALQPGDKIGEDLIVKRIKND